MRIWKAALPAETIRQWMSRPLEAKHPFYSHLKGYYNFDDMQIEAALNWVGYGHQPYHLRNGRNDYKGKQPLAYAVPNDNPTFVTPCCQQHLFNAVEVQSEWDADQGTTGNQILKLRIAVRGSGKPLKLTELCLDLSGTDHLSDIDKVHLFIPAKRPVRSSDKKYLAWPENLNKRCCTKWIGMVGSYHRELTISWSLSISLQTPYPVIF